MARSISQVSEAVAKSATGASDLQSAALDLNNQSGELEGLVSSYQF